GLRRRRLIGLITLAVVIILVGTAALLWVLGDRPVARPERPDLPVDHELLETARPDPACTKLPRPVPSGSGDTRLTVIRLRGHCLVTETVLVGGADAPARPTELREQPDVVTADVARAAGPPDFGGYRSDAGEPVEQRERDA